MNKKEKINREKVLKAYDYTMSVIKELEENGIIVKRVPSSSRTNKKLVEEYNLPERLPPDKWFYITLVAKNKEDQELIFEKSKDLAEFGISFDTGMGCCGRDWEIDWSFRYTENVEKNHGDRLDIVEDLGRQLFGDM